MTLPIASDNAAPMRIMLAVTMLSALLVLGGCGNSDNIELCEGCSTPVPTPTLTVTPTLTSTPATPTTTPVP